MIKNMEYGQGVPQHTTTGLEAHANRSMNTYLYRAVFYNRNAINNPGSQEPGAEDPSLGNS